MVKTRRGFRKDAAQIWERRGADLGKTRRGFGEGRDAARRDADLGKTRRGFRKDAARIWERRGAAPPPISQPPFPTNSIPNPPSSKVES